MTGSDQRLVFLDDDRAEAALARLQQLGRITQVASRRLVVVEGGGDRAQLESIPGVVAATTSALPAHVSARLHDDEALFADAWAVRAQQGPKTRIGDGLPWDAPGFLPPDPPHAPSGEPGAT